MKKILVCAVVTCAVFAFSSAASAGWNTCIACHNGNVAPGKEKLVEKYKTAESFVKAAKESKNPMMKSIQKDDAALQDAAKDIGLK